MRYLPDESTLPYGPATVSVSCSVRPCRESRQMHEEAAREADRCGHEVRCERCDDNEVTHADSWADCDECGRKTPQRDYSNPAAAWSFCAWCGSKTYEA